MNTPFRYTASQLACVAGVETGRGRGNLGARATLSRAPKFPLPLPLPLSTPATQATSQHAIQSLPVVSTQVDSADV